MKNNKFKDSVWPIHSGSELRTRATKGHEAPVCPHLAQPQERCFSLTLLGEHRAPISFVLVEIFQRDIYGTLENVVTSYVVAF